MTDRSCYLFIRVLLACFALSISTRSESAEVAVVNDIWGNRLIVISGEIKPGDTEKVKRLSAEVILSQPAIQRKALRFELNTPGGDVEEAIKLGRYFRYILAYVTSYGKIIVAEHSKDAETILQRRHNNDANSPTDRDYVILSRGAALTNSDIVRNYSSGIIIFFGAVQRAHRDNSDQRDGFYNKVSIPVMGIHRPYFSKEAFAKLSPSDAEKAYSLLENHVRAYMTEMGAPQALLDRMFNSASNKIELVPAEEFRSYYKSKESFLDEWLIAKCGSTNEQESLSSDELKDFQLIQLHQIRSRSKDTSADQRAAYYLYPNPDYSSTYVEKLYSKVRKHNASVNLCNKTALVNHQTQWAKSFK